MRIALLLPVAALLWSCATVPTDPAALGNEIIRDLDAGLEAEADAAFADIAGSARLRETLYPVLFGEARSRYAAGDYEGAARLLRFSASHYEAATAVREALLYTLFLVRAGLPAPDAALAREMDALLVELRERGAITGPWADLVAAQNAIDRGRVQEAEAPFQRFLATWDGQPAELAAYVQDLGRYIQSPPGAGREGDS